MKQTNGNFTRYAILLLVNTAILFGIYCYFVMREGVLWLFWLYYVALAAVSIAYVVYNRGFSRENLTWSELPREWSEAEKEAFLRSRDERKKKSKWLLTLLFPLVLTVFFDMIYLFFGDAIIAAFSDVAKFFGIS